MKKDFVTALFFLLLSPLLGQQHLESQKFQGIWRSVHKKDNTTFYFIIQSSDDYEGGTGYTISLKHEATFSWTYKNGCLYFTQFDANYKRNDYESCVNYFDGRIWRYSVSTENGYDTYEATRISDPLRNISNNRLKVGSFMYSKGFEKWCLYEKNGNRPVDIAKAYYFRIAKSVKNIRPGVVSYGTYSEGYGIEGSTFYYVEDYFITNELQFRGYYHSFLDTNGATSRGNVLDWDLPLEGPCKWYNKNGTIMQEGRYKQGILYGACKIYNENGKLIKTIQGKPLSEYEYFIEDQIIGSRTD